MDKQRPRSREKHITGSKKTVQKRGNGLGTGPVGYGHAERQPGEKNPSGSFIPSPKRSNAPSGGLSKLLFLLLALVLGGGGALLGLPSAQSPSGTNQTLPQAQQTSPQAGQNAQGNAAFWETLLGSLGGGSVSSGWLEPANTGKLNTSVSPLARDKRVKLLGDGRDTATIMVYMCGTDLESRSGMGTADIQEMLAADLGENINLLVYTGGCTDWHSSPISNSVNQIWQIKNKKLLCLESDLGNVSMTNPATLTGFIQWCARRFPASRYQLIFWDHGGGSISGYGYDQKFPSSGSMGLSGIHTALTNAEVEFDFIGFDACLMATAENALMLTQHADYLIASEETEPGVGWYYTNWLTAFGADPSMPTLKLGQRIADDFVDVCSQKCLGQMTTLSVVDLAELEATIPSGLNDFSQAASNLISSKQYQTLSDARSHTREFAKSSRIDHVDLVHLARNLGNSESNALADALLSAVKYNRTSSNMTNAYGLSIYFPYQNVSKVDKAVASYRQIGMDEAYVRCIEQFASMEASGQAVSGGSTSPLPSLLGSLSSGTDSSEMISQLLGNFLGGNFEGMSGFSSANTGFLSNKGLDGEDAVQYFTDHHFDSDALTWNTGTDNLPVIHLDEDQWKLVQSLELNLFYDDGEGFIDMGLDNVFEFNDSGELIGAHDSTWLAIEGQPVAYYHTATIDDGESYNITGRVPVLCNGVRSELLLAFDNEHPYGYITGVRTVYSEDETETVAKSDFGLQPGDTLEFLCDYYGYNGSYLDSYLLGDPLTVTSSQPAISNVPLEGNIRATYRFTDLYNQHYWTPAIP